MWGQGKLVDKLREMARNLWWTWHPDVINLFRELDPILWRVTDHNPIEFLKKISPEQLERRAAEMALHSRIDYAARRLGDYLKNTDSWGAVYATSLRSRTGTSPVSWSPWRAASAIGKASIATCLPRRSITAARIG